MLEYFFSCIFVSISWVVVYFIDVCHNDSVVNFQRIWIKLWSKCSLSNLCSKMMLGSEHGRALDGKVNEPPFPLTGNYLHGYSYNPAIFIIGYRTWPMQRWERSEIHLKNIIMNDCLKTKYKVKFPLKKNQ